MDLAEPVDDLICTFDGTGDTTMDTLAMFVFGWILAALFVLWLGKIIYSKFVARERLNDIKLKTDTIIKSSEVVADTIDAKAGVKSATLPVVSSSPSSSKGGGGSGGYVPPTPPVRKRLTRQSPAPDLKKNKYVPAPTCTGPDNVSVLWVNDVFQWLYNDLVIVNELLNVWIQSLNEYTKKSVTEQGVGVELIRILPETHPPSLTNIFCECDTKEDITITCDCEATPAFQLKCFRQKGDKIETNHYRVNVNRFRARMNIYCISEKLQVDIKCDGWPDIKIALAPVGVIKNNIDETQLQDVISEVLITALRHTEVHLNLAQYPTCPRLIRHVQTLGHILPVHYDSMMTNAFSSTPNNHTGVNIRSKKKLLVKVLSANQLGATAGCTEPFCIVEMDDPPQKNQTSIQKNTNSPSWNEHFLFELSENTAELLFEIYDHAVKPHQFLGLGIVGVEELYVNPSQRQIISLQSRPYESDSVSGSLTVEFMFIESADVPLCGNQPYKIKESIRSVSPITKFGHDSYRSQNENLTNGEYYNSSLKESDRQNFNSSNQNTLIVHSVQRQPSQRLVKVELSDGNWKEVERIEKTLEEKLTGIKQGEKFLSSIESNSEPTNTNGTLDNSIESEESKSEIQVKSGDISLVGDAQIPLDDNRGRQRKRRDFFGTIKRRLGKSKTRSRSAGPGDNGNERGDSMSRSISADRRHDESYHLNVPGGKLIDETSRRSSLSEASGLSGASTRTYINEASTLVLETIENGIKKHYLVPLSLAQKSKWRKKGVKLHIFNDHTFIAKHLSGGTVCQVCSKSIARRIGKQGYECRDCLLKCHKHCHVKVNDNCPTSTIHNIELSLLPVLSE